MKSWAAVFVSLPILMVLLHLAARLWPKRAGYRYLRRRLARRGIETRQISPACIRALVDDAHDYATTACRQPSGTRGAAATVAHFEFERTLRLHACVVHALVTGKTAAEADAEEADPESWHRCRAILRRHDLPMPISHDAIVELSQ